MSAVTAWLLVLPVYRHLRNGAKYDHRNFMANYL